MGLQFKPLAYFAGADLSAKQFYAVTLDSAGKIVLDTSAAAPGLGALENAPELDGEGTVAVTGKAKGRVGAAVAMNAELTVDGNGKYVTAGAGEYVKAIALRAASADEVVIPIKMVTYQKN